MITSLGTWFVSLNSIMSWDYLIDRLDINFILTAIEMTFYEISNPNHPWINPKMIPIIASVLTPKDVGFEFGSGRSTVWLAKQVKFLYSVENDKNWFYRVKKLLSDNNLKNKVKLFYSGKVDEYKKIGLVNYLQPIKTFKNESLDFCFVDGYFRDECILLSISKLKHGGVLIIDNVDNYFPKNQISKSIRYKRDNFSKAVDKNKMNKIYSVLSDWRCIWMTNSIQDTALWIKP